MKTITLILLATFIANAQPNSQPVPKQVEGDVSYYAIQDSRELWIELPYKLQGSIVSAEDTHVLNVFVEANKNLKRPEVESLRAKYPGYKLVELGVLKVLSVELNLGIQKTLTLSEDPSGHAAFFSGEVLLSESEARFLRQNLAANRQPALKLELERPAPVETIKASFKLQTKKLCDQLADATRSKALKFSKALSQLFETLAPHVKLAPSSSLRERAVDRFTSNCVSIEASAGAAIEEARVSFVPKYTTPTEVLNEFEITTLPVASEAKVESTWRSL